MLGSEAKPEAIIDNELLKIIPVLLSPASRGEEDSSPLHTQQNGTNVERPEPPFKKQKLAKEGVNSNCHPASR